MDNDLQEQLAQIASMYYEQDMTQNVIAKALGLSRVKVYRLLKQAREANVVQITINWPTKRDSYLEDALKEVFGLDDALVLHNASGNSTVALPSLGKLVAGYLEHLLSESPTMAICLGRSTYETINAIRSDLQAKVQVVQAVGSLPHAMREYDSSVLARQLAEKLGGDVVYLSSPPMADTSEAAAVIRSQREIHRTLVAARSADVALVGIGCLDPTMSGFVKAGFILPDELKALVADGAVGDITWQIYTIDGEPYPCDFNERVIGITMEELGQIPITVAVALGAEKVRAILGGLRTGVINVLGTDDRTAAAVLELNQTLNGRR